MKYAFGPIWCAMVRDQKGFVFHEWHRKKLNAHGVAVGVQSPEKLSTRDLCTEIAKRMPESAYSGDRGKWVFDPKTNSQVGKPT